MMFDGSTESFMSPSAPGNTAEANFTGMPAGTYRAKIKVVNTSSIVINGTTFTNEEGWVSVGGSLDSIVCTQNGPNSAVVHAIELDGKLLVDGTRAWNTSEVWSDNLIGSGGSFVTNQENYKAFDGDETSYAAISKGTLLWTGNIPFTDKVEIRVQNSTQGYSANSGEDAGNVSPNTWTEIAVTSPFTQLSITGADANTATAARLVGIKVDGAFLVDGAPAWNSSQMWSDSYTSSEDGMVTPVV